MPYRHSSFWLVFAIVGGLLIAPAWADSGTAGSGCVFGQTTASGAAGGDAPDVKMIGPTVDQTTQDTPQFEAAQAAQQARDQQAYDQQQDDLPLHPEQDQQLNDLNAQEQDPVNQLNFDPPRFESPHFDAQQCP
jgi:hypothetical protein